MNNNCKCCHSWSCQAKPSQEWLEAVADFTRAAKINAQKRIQEDREIDKIEAAQNKRAVLVTIAAVVLLTIIMSSIFLICFSAHQG